MAFVRPTLPDLVTRIQQDFVSRLELTGAVLRRAVVRVLSRVIAGAAHMLHGHVEFLGRQLFADQSEPEYLARQASLYGYSRAAAAFAGGEIIAVGTDDAVIVAGTRMLRGDGVVYEVLLDATVSGGVCSLLVAAVLAGEAGNADAETVVTFESPIADVSVTASVGDSGLTGGADAESTASLRARLLARLRNAPQGGAEGDYSVWALEVPGVTRVWVSPRELGAGTVAVRFVRDGDADPFPSAGEVEDVQAYIDERRPVTADVTVSAPVAEEWDFTLSVTPNTVAVKAAVEAEIEDLFRREGAPGVTLPLSKVRTAIGIADGIEDYTLTTPSADLTHAAGELPVVGTVTYV